jgi:hypothetical protein
VLLSAQQVEAQAAWRLRQAPQIQVPVQPWVQAVPLQVPVQARTQAAWRPARAEARVQAPLLARALRELPLL